MSGCLEEDLPHLEDMRQGGHKGFTILYKRYEKRLRATLLSKSYLDPAHSDVDTVVSDTFMRFYRSIDNFREECSVFTWLYRLSFYAYQDGIKDNQDHHRDKNKDGNTGELPSTGDIEHEICIRQCFDLYIKNLTEKDNQYKKHIGTLTLVAQGLTMKELKNELGKPTVNATKQFVFGCRQKLHSNSNYTHPVKKCIQDCSS